jgi:hypothetical protein
MMEALGSTDTSVLTRATRRNIPEDGILLYGTLIGFGDEGSVPASSLLPGNSALACGFSKDEDLRKVPWTEQSKRVVTAVSNVAFSFLRSIVILQHTPLKIIDTFVPSWHDFRNSPS